MRRLIPCIAILAASIAFEGCSHFHSYKSTSDCGCGCDGATPAASVMMPPAGGYIVPGVTAVPQVFTTRGATSSIVR